MVLEQLTIHKKEENGEGGDNLALHSSQILTKMDHRIKCKMGKYKACRI